LEVNCISFRYQFISQSTFCNRVTSEFYSEYTLLLQHTIDEWNCKLKLEELFNLTSCPLTADLLTIQPLQHIIMHWLIYF